MLNFFQNNNLTIVKYYIKNCPPESLFNFLCEHNQRGQSQIPKEFADEMELAMYDLGEPLVSLGLARYGQNVNVIRKLYLESNVENRIAALSNKMAFNDRTLPYTNWLSASELEEIILSGSQNEQEAILKNAHLDTKVIEEIYKKEKAFQSISEGLWQKLITYSIGNVLLYKQVEKNESSITWSNAIDSAWQLAMTVSVDDKWACILMGLYENIARINSTKINIEYAIERWNVEPENKEQADAYESICINLADLIDVNSNSEQLKSSDIPALRYSFYKRFLPKSKKELDQFYDRDREKFVYWALLNPRVLTNEDFSKLLREQCRQLDDGEPFYEHIYLKNKKKM